MDRNDPPPDYNDLLLQRGVKPGSQSSSHPEKHPLMGMDTAGHQPSAPSLPTDNNFFASLSALDLIMTEIPNTFNIKDLKPTAAGTSFLSSAAFIESQAQLPEEFCVRDVTESLLVQGSVEKSADQTNGFQNIVLQNVNQEVFLTISSENDRILVRHKTVDIGELKLIETTGCVTISKSCENRMYSVNQLNPSDIVISGTSSPGYICKLHFPSTGRFNCSVVFSDRSEVTAIEKCLGLSVALVFMSARNAVASAAAAKEATRCHILGMPPWLIYLLFLGAGVGFCFFLVIYFRFID